MRPPTPISALMPSGSSSTSVYSLGWTRTRPVRRHQSEVGLGGRGRRSGRRRRWAAAALAAAALAAERTAAELAVAERWWSRRRAEPAVASPAVEEPAASSGGGGGGGRRGRRRFRGPRAPLPSPLSSQIIRARAPRSFVAPNACAAPGRRAPRASAQPRRCRSRRMSATRRAARENRRLQVVAPRSPRACRSCSTRARSRTSACDEVFWERLGDEPLRVSGTGLSVPADRRPDAQCPARNLPARRRGRPRPRRRRRRRQGGRVEPGAVDDYADMRGVGRHRRRFELAARAQRLPQDLEATAGVAPAPTSPRLRIDCEVTHRPRPVPPSSYIQPRGEYELRGASTTWRRSPRHRACCAASSACRLCLLFWLCCGRPGKEKLYVYQVPDLPMKQVEVAFRRERRGARCVVNKSSWFSASQLTSSASRSRRASLR